MKINYKIKTTEILFSLTLLFGVNVWAEPVIVEGIVPNQASKQTILAKMYSIYGADQIIDKIQVKAVNAPSGWSESVANMVVPELKKVHQGKLSVRGTQMELNGKVMNSMDIQPITNLFQGLVIPPYRLNTQFSVNQAEQQIIDDTLKNRIIEFESGSAILAVSGTQILDEMALALNKVGGKKVRIVGHTDSSGDATKNLALSKERAIAVKNYLLNKHIAEERLSVEGMGANKPVADNATADGRKKNRRIEFDVI